MSGPMTLPCGRPVPRGSLYKLEADRDTYRYLLDERFTFRPRHAFHDSDEWDERRGQAVCAAADLLVAVDRFEDADVSPESFLEVLADWDQRILYHRMDDYQDVIEQTPETKSLQAWHDKYRDENVKLKRQLKKARAKNRTLKAELDELKACC